MPERADLGSTLRRIRQDKGLPEVELAKMLGSAETSVSRYEADGRLPSTDVLEKIGEALGVSKRPRRGVATMLGRLGRLDTVMALPNVGLAIFPLDVEPPQTPLSAFVLYDDELIAIETLTEELEVRDPPDVAIYAKAYDAFRAASV